MKKTLVFIPILPQRNIGISLFWERYLGSSFSVKTLGQGSFNFIIQKEGIWCGLDQVELKTTHFSYQCLSLGVSAGFQERTFSACFSRSKQHPGECR
jgi:hypothetical protein